MAKKIERVKSKRTSLTPPPTIINPNITFPKGEFLILDKEKMPMAGFGIGPELKFPKEFNIIDSMQVDQSCVFPTDKQNIIDRIRVRISKFTEKKFIVKKVGNGLSRIWRVPDGTITRHGGRRLAKRGYKKNKGGVSIAPPQSVNNQPQPQS